MSNLNTFKKFNLIILLLFVIIFIFMATPAASMKINDTSSLNVSVYKVIFGGKVSIHLEHYERQYIPLDGSILGQWIFGFILTSFVGCMVSMVLSNNNHSSLIVFKCSVILLLIASTAYLVFGFSTLQSYNNSNIKIGFGYISSLLLLIGTSIFGLVVSNIYL